ncbi:MAG TPA: hypothetical protein VE861_13590, partial [Gemmatimonadaceae bacterium]|nr:hypothetical protein [Gemmatimonadaceae bacterium]
QPSSRDANFGGVERFTLAAEGGRPVYVAAGSIVPATGAATSTDARRDAGFGSVLVSGSQARSVSTQFRITASPDMPRFSTLRVSYVAARIRARENGTDRNTGSDPRAFEWTDGDLDTRHQVQVQGSFQYKLVSMSLFANMLSGAPYTPIVAGDINGDGVTGNDRAFVSRGANAPSEFREGMRKVLETAPDGARKCLTSALERMAARNSCRGPWSATLNAQFSANGKALRLPREATVSVSMRNLLGGIDQAINGANLRGWGTRAAPDPQLYSVRGFDPSSNRYLYDVNPRFGATNPKLTALRVPFVVTLDVAMPFSPSYPAQTLTRALRNGRNGFPGPKRDSAALVTRYRRTAPELYGQILELRDSLLLTNEQLALVQSAQAALTARTDSVWGALAAHLATLGDRYDTKAELARQNAATGAIWELLWKEACTLDTVFNASQLKLLPYPASYLRTISSPPKWY